MPAVFEEDGTVSRVPTVRSEPMLAALDILRRLVDGLSEQYDERECPNGKPACGMCKLVSEAKAFLSANIPISVERRRE